MSFISYDVNTCSAVIYKRYDCFPPAAGEAKTYDYVGSLVFAVYMVWIITLFVLPIFCDHTSLRR